MTTVDTESLDIRQAKIDVLHQEWINHPYTTIFINALMDSRNQNLSQAEAEALIVPKNQEMIDSKLIQAATIKHTIQYAQKPIKLSTHANPKK